jgi:hypothetical protein
MPMLHESDVRSSIRSRVQSLTPRSTRKWGKMSVDQMLWHCNQVLATSLGDVVVELRRPPFPVPVLKFFLFNLPWPKGAPTAPEYQAVDVRVFEEEQQRCLDLIDRFAAQRIDRDNWPRAVFGPLTGLEWSRLHARHLDHHLKQFSA